MGSDFVYYLLTTLRGKQTLGEEYCSILPVSIKTDKFPSPFRRLLFCLLNITGPYLFNRLLRKFEQPLNEYVVDQNDKLHENITKATFKDILRVNLLSLLPGVYNTCTKQINQLHLALFFLWGKYYEIAKRFAGIKYKYVQGLENQHQIEYIRPGRFIMAQMLIQVIMFQYKVIKTIYASYQQWKKLEKKRQEQKNLQAFNDQNPQEDGKSQQEEDQQQQNEENAEQDQCVLCYGQRINTTATQCGHLFCWDCIQTSLKVKPECPQCREPCVPQKSFNSLLTFSRKPFSFYNAQDYNSDFKKNIENQYIVKSDKEYRFAIIGCGPAGFYCAKQILKNVRNVRVDIYDRNPHPFGLVRTGVAPDHPEMKKIENDYAEVLHDTERCKFFGNVWVGINGGISIEQLKEKYSGVVLAYGATSERKLGLPNEYELKGVMSSRKIVNWYNGSLDREIDYSQEIDLDHLRDLAIVGNGNVAMDISRILLKDPLSIAPYDIPSSVVDLLLKSTLQNIQVIGRRGAVQSAFTIKEIREVSKIPNVQILMMREEFEKSMNENSQLETGAGFSPVSRAVARKTEFLKSMCRFIESEEEYQDRLADKSGVKKLFLRYLLNPVELIPDEKKRISKVRLQQMILQGDAGLQKAVKDPKGHSIDIDCQLLIKSIGYQSKPIAGVPFDTKNSTIPHDQGCIVNEQGQTLPGLYVAGWVKRGPVGIIDSTLRDSIDTFRVIKHHLECDMLQEKKTTVEDLQQILPKDQKVVTYEDWQKIDKVEKQRGQEKGKIREKILDKEEMLKIIS